APVNVSALASSAGSPSPAIAMTPNGDKVVAVFAQFQDPLHQIQARTSTNSGATYTAAVPVAANVTAPSDLEVVSSADGQRLAAVWQEDVGAVETIRASFSNNGGGTWSSPETLSNPARDSSNPNLLTNADGSRVVAVWQEFVGSGESLIQTRTLAGGFWSSPAVRLSPVGQSSNNPQISGAADGSRATVAWANETAKGVQSAHAVGDTWSGPGAVSEPGPAVFTPDVASSADGLRVSAVWNKSSTQILSSESDDGGATWSVPVSTSAAAAGTGSPRIAAADSGFRYAAVWVRPDGSDKRIQAGTYFEAQSQTITLQQPADLPVGSSTALTATASSGLPVTLASTTPGTCSVTGSQLTAVAPGTCSIVASQPGDVDFLPAADVTRSLTVVAATPPVGPRQQSLGCAKTPPGKLKRRGTTVVLPKNCRTDAGQRVTVKVSGKRKDLRNVKVIKKAGKTSIRTFGTRVKLKLTYRAAGTSTVDPFVQVRRYRT
ncbi:MAG: glycoside hydrolase, partial [Candidatus Nanopelagicales bacterium]|nr:glycoside hydrolase [Candidatus Nanopelagicales bacterium]